MLLLIHLLDKAYYIWIKSHFSFIKHSHGPLNYLSNISFIYFVPSQHCIIERSSFASVTDLQIFICKLARISKHGIHCKYYALRLPLTQCLHFQQSVGSTAFQVPELSMPFPAQIPCFSSVECRGDHDFCCPTTVDIHVTPFTNVPCNFRGNSNWKGRQEFSRLL